MSQELISLIIPVYNVEQYLADSSIVVTALQPLACSPVGSIRKLKANSNYLENKQNKPPFNHRAESVACFLVFEKLKTKSNN